jgi:hypothetical protein
MSLSSTRTKSFERKKHMSIDVFYIGFGSYLPTSFLANTARTSHLLFLSLSTLSTSDLCRWPPLLEWVCSQFQRSGHDYFETLSMQQSRGTIIPFLAQFPYNSLFRQLAGLGCPLLLLQILDHLSGIKLFFLQRPIAAPSCGAKRNYQFSGQVIVGLGGTGKSYS